MSTNGKGSKRRPETAPGTYVRNWDEINWGTKDDQTRRPRSIIGHQLEQDLKTMQISGVADRGEAVPFPEPPE